MTRKLQTQDDLGGRHFIRKEQLHAERAKDINPLKQKHSYVKMPRNPSTHISIRLPQDLCDWVWEMYPNEPTISSAVQQYIKDMYGSRIKDSPV